MERDPVTGGDKNRQGHEAVATKEGTLSGIVVRALAVWLVLICAEILHGIARGIFLVPHVGEFRSNQIGVLTGSIIILADRSAVRAMDRRISDQRPAGGRRALAGADVGFRDSVRTLRDGSIVGAARRRLQCARRWTAAIRYAISLAVAVDCREGEGMCSCPVGPSRGLAVRFRSCRIVATGNVWLVK